MTKLKTLLKNLKLKEFIDRINNNLVLKKRLIEIYQLYKLEKEQYKKNIRALNLLINDETMKNLFN